MAGAQDDLTGLLPLLEQPYGESGLDAETAVRLVAHGLNARSDWWANKALDWVDEGVVSPDIALALRRTAHDKRYSQQTRHRAWRYVTSDW